MYGNEEALSECYENSCIIAIDNTKLKSSADLKVKSAHELGHCITGAFYDEKCPVIPRGRCERRATNWAIRQLISERELRRALRQGNTELWQLSDYFNVTGEFMVDVLKYYNMWNGD